MSGSEASNLGYSEYPPNHNINGTFVNVNNTNNPANFGSNEIPPRGLFGASCNMDAASGIAPGICMGGGSKKRTKSFKLLKKKIKNISNIYKMKYTKKQRRHIKSKISRKYRLNKNSKMRKSKRHMSSKRHRRHMRKMQKGGAMAELGYSNFHGSEDYAGTKLSYSEANPSSGYGFHVPSGDAQINSALASPTPISSYAKLN